MTHHRYRTVVGGIGTVYDGDSAMEAHGEFNRFVAGYAGDGKSVMVFKDCEIVKAYKPERVRSTTVTF